MSVGKINFSELYDIGVYVFNSSIDLTDVNSKAAKEKLKENNGTIMTFEAFLKSMYKAEDSVDNDIDEEEEEEDEYAFLYDSHDDDTDKDKSPMEMEFSPIRGKLSFNNSMESDALFENSNPPTYVLLLHPHPPPPPPPPPY